MSSCPSVAADNTVWKAFNVTPGFELIGLFCLLALAVIEIGSTKGSRVIAGISKQVSAHAIEAL